MKTPIQTESTLGIMMSGESPTPAPHGDRRYDFKDSLMGPPMSAPRNTVDKGVQIELDDFKQYSQNNTLKDLSPNSHPPSSAKTSEKNSIANTQFERIDKADEIVTSPPELYPKSKATTKRPEEEIQSAVDQTDSRAPVDKKVKPEQEENCLVDCLYYVDQCCECRIL